MGKCMFMRKGSVHTAPMVIPANFVDATWEQIIEICQKNRVPDTWAVGDSKPMTINGTTYNIDIIGKNHDEYSDGSGKAPLTFQMHECYATQYTLHSSNTNSVSWSGCTMRTSTLPKTFMPLMPVEVQSAIREVNKLTSAGNGGSSIVVSADKLFLLSEVEVMGETNYSFAGEGVQYEYYKVSSSRIDKSKVTYWTRSPYTDTRNFIYIMNNSNYGTTSPVGSYAITPAFCF